LVLLCGILAAVQGLGKFLPWWAELADSVEARWLNSYFAQCIHHFHCGAYVLYVQEHKVLLDNARFLILLAPCVRCADGMTISYELVHLYLQDSCH
jgi:hypothetical protein